METAAFVEPPLPAAAAAEDIPPPPSVPPPPPPPNPPLPPLPPPAPEDPPPKKEESRPGDGFESSAERSGMIAGSGPAPSPSQMIARQTRVRMRSTRAAWKEGDVRVNAAVPNDSGEDEASTANSSCKILAISDMARLTAPSDTDVIRVAAEEEEEDVDDDEVAAEEEAT